MLGKLVTFSKGNRISKEELSPDGIPCVLYGQMYTDFAGQTQIDAPTLRTNNPPSKPFVCEQGQVIIPGSGETHEDISNAACLRFGGALLGGDINVITPSPALRGDFLACLFRGVLKNDIASVAQGDSVVHLNANNLKSLDINYPSSIFEQRKIAQTIRLLEQRIEVQRKTIEDWKIIKFSSINSEFETCTDALETAVKELSTRYKRFDKPCKVFSVSNTNGFIEQSEQFSGKAVAGENKDNYKVVYPGEFAYNPARINVGSIARYEGTSPVIISPMYVCFCVVKKYLPSYLNYFFTSASFIKQMRVHLEGSVRQCLLFDSLQAIKAPAADKTKQIKFVESIKALDLIIRCESSILEKLESTKAFLLQVLFI